MGTITVLLSLLFYCIILKCAIISFTAILLFFWKSSLISPEYRVNAHSSPSPYSRQFPKSSNDTAVAWFLMRFWSQINRALTHVMLVKRYKGGFSEASCMRHHRKHKRWKKMVREEKPRHTRSTIEPLWGAFAHNSCEEEGISEGGRTHFAIEVTSWREKAHQYGQKGGERPIERIAKFSQLVYIFSVSFLTLFLWSCHPQGDAFSQQFVHFSLIFLVDFLWDFIVFFCWDFCALEIGRSLLEFLCSWENRSEEKLGNQPEALWMSVYDEIRKLAYAVKVKCYKGMISIESI